MEPILKIDKIEKLAKCFGVTSEYLINSDALLDDPNTIGERIYKRRTELNLSVDDVAKKLNKNRATIYRYENNEIENMPASILNSLAGILKTTPAYLMGWENWEDSINQIVSIHDYKITKSPIIGTITAGYDGIAYEEDLGEIEVLDTALNGYAAEECFVLKIKGDSMYPLFLNNDLVLVHKQNHVDSGTIAVVLYNGDEATVKKVVYKQGENWLDLIPSNPEYMTKHIENEELEQCRIIGKVISLVLRKI